MKKIKKSISILIIVMLLSITIFQISTLANSSVSNDVDKKHEIITNMSHGPTWNKYMKNGNWILETSSGLINYNDNGIWKPINLKFHTDNHNYLVIDEAPYILKISHDKSYYLLYPDRNNPEKWINVSMPNINTKESPFYKTQLSSSPSNSLHWNFDNFNINIIPTNSMVSFEYVLKNTHASNAISMKIIPHNCTITSNGFIDGGKYQIINQAYNKDHSANIKTTYNPSTNMLDIKVDTENIKYPIILDPTISIAPTSYGGYIAKTATTWTEAHDSPTGDSVWNTYIFSRVGHIVNNIHRSYIYFNTSAINPSVTNFISGNISIYGESDTSSGLFDIVLQHNETGDHPEIPLLVTDYNYRYYNDSNLGSFPTSSYVVNGWNYIQLNTSGLENITRNGYTKYCLRSSLDISNTSGGARYIDYYNCRSYYPPVLTLVWNGPEITNEYPVNGSTGVQRYVDNISITVNDSTGLSMDINWYIWITGSWWHFGLNESVTNGTYRQAGASTDLGCWNFPYQWKVCVNNSDGVWTNKTYIFTTINSTAPTISNMYPQNRTFFSEGTNEISLTVNDTEAEQISIEVWICYGKCSYRYFVSGGWSNRTYTIPFNPKDYPSGTIQWFARVKDISCVHTDNVVFSDVYWFTNKGSWNDHFCGRDERNICKSPLNLINRTDYTSYISPLRSDDTCSNVLYDNPSIVEFQQYMNNTASDGMDASQSVIATSAYIGSNAGPRIVFINETVGYTTTIVYSSSLHINRLYIKKTIDGGTTWTTVAVSSSYNELYYVGMWYDGWTSGDYESKIHLALIRIHRIHATNQCELVYGYFDTDTETLHIDYDTVIHTFHYLTHRTDGRPSITISTDGNIFLSAWGGKTEYDQYGYHGVVFRSNDSGRTWTDITPSESFFGTPYGYFRYTFATQASCILLPHGENNVSLILRNFFGLSNSVYDFTTCSWNNFVSVGSGSIGAYYSGTYWKNTGDIYLAWQTTLKNAGGAIKFKKYSLENKTWWGEKTIESNVYGYDASIVISEGNGDLYVFYGNSSTDSDSYMNISCRNSTDHGATWGPSQRLNSNTPQWASYTYGNLMSEYRIFGSWYDWGWDYQRCRSIREYTETNSYGNTGNLTSVEITLPNEFYWCTFNADYTTQSNGINFSIYNKTGNLLLSNLDGNSNDISSITDRTIYLNMYITNTSKIDSWNVTFAYLNTTVSVIIPWHVTTYPLVITASGSSNLDNVTLWYRWSPDNVTWGENMSFVTDMAPPWSWKFNFTNSSGYYQFYSIGKLSNCGADITENPPPTPDTWCHFVWDDFIQDISDTVVGRWNTGILTSLIGGISCVFGSFVVISCRHSKENNWFCKS